MESGFGKSPEEGGQVGKQVPKYMKPYRRGLQEWGRGHLGGMGNRMARGPGGAESSVWHPGTCTHHTCLEVFQGPSRLGE